jgi:hypothetical protein
MEGLPIAEGVSSITAPGEHYTEMLTDVFPSADINCVEDESDDSEKVDHSEDEDDGAVYGYGGWSSHRVGSCRCWSSDEEGEYKYY